MIHITENINRTIGKKESLTLKLTKCPFCGQEIGYYITQPLQCTNCYMGLPDFDLLFGPEGLGEKIQRLAFHKGVEFLDRYS